MNRLFVPAALAFALAGGMAIAQTPTTPAPDAQQPALAVQQPAQRHHNSQREVKRLSKELKLTADQSSKLEQIFADRDQKLEELQANSQAQDSHKQMRAIRKSTDEQLATVLTPDQMQQMKSMHHGHQQQPATQPLTPQTT